MIPQVIAALYVQKRGCYFGLPDVDPWDEERDARGYAGPHPVVAHPPCARWCKLAGLVEARGGHKRGDDGGTFAAALASVRRWGGVLEHPAYTKAWAAHDLTAPAGAGWQRDLWGGWVCEVNQVAYGHRAQKRTWLYAVTNDPPPALLWGEPEHEAVVGNGRNRGSTVVELMSARERSATPVDFRDALLSIARAAR